MTSFRYAFALALIALVPDAHAQCERWSTTFGVRGPDQPVQSIGSFDDGTGPALYVGGHFQWVGGFPITRIARWKNGTWSELGSGMNQVVDDLHVFDDGTGEALYAAGRFTIAGGITSLYVARWDGTSWSNLGSGMSSWTLALETFDDGGGEDLYAGGWFVLAGGVAAIRIARWDGSAWSPLGTGLSGTTGSIRVNDLKVFDDGTGDALYATGTFTLAGGSPASRIARWDGTAWTPLGNGLTHAFTTAEGNAIEVFDDGNGPALYVAGTFDRAGTAAAGGIARWDGTAWSALADELNGEVTELQVIAGEGGTELIAGGNFTMSGPEVMWGVARWNGTQWSDLDTGVGAGFGTPVRALGVHSSGDAPEQLFVGGDFDFAGSAIVSNVATWYRTGKAGCTGETGVTYCAGDGSGTACPCGNTGAVARGCDNAQGTGGVELALVSFEPDGAGGGSTFLRGSGHNPSASPTVIALRAEVTGPAGPATAFGDGLLCVAPPVVRLGATNADFGTSTSSISHGAGAGTYRYQLWYRSTPITFCDPTAAFNTSNAIEVVWP